MLTLNTKPLIPFACRCFLEAWYVGSCVEDCVQNIMRFLFHVWFAVEGWLEGVERCCGVISCAVNTRGLRYGVFVVMCSWRTW